MARPPASPASSVCYLKGGRAWCDLPSPEDCKGWQARAARDGRPLRYKADLNSGEIWKVDGDGTPCKLMSIHAKDKTGVDGYYSINLTFPGAKRKTFLLHALICWAAKGPMSLGCSSVDHLDRNPKNNKAINLSWASTTQQAANRRPGGRKKMLPFVQEPGEVLYQYLGSPGVGAYSGPSLVFTSLRRIVRDGKLSQAISVDGGYPRIKVQGRMQCVHRLAWAAYHPGEEVPRVIDHVNGIKTDWRESNLRASNSSHNGTAAHDIGAFAGTKSERQAVQIFANRERQGVPWVYGSRAAAAKALGADRGNIGQSVRVGCAFTGTRDGVKTKFWASRAAAPAAASSP